MEEGENFEGYIREGVIPIGKYFKEKDNTFYRVTSSGIDHHSRLHVGVIYYIYHDHYTPQEESFGRGNNLICPDKEKGGYWEVFSHSVLCWLKHKEFAAPKMPKRISDFEDRFLESSKNSLESTLAQCARIV